MLKGPTSLLYGLMDPGGVVNVVSKQPQLTRYNAISLGASTFGHGKNGGSATFDSTGPIGDSRLAYRLIVDQSNEQYWRNFGEYRQTFVAPSLAWYGRDTQVVASYEYRKFHFAVRSRHGARSAHQRAARHSRAAAHRRTVQ